MLTNSKRILFCVAVLSIALPTMAANGAMITTDKLIELPANSEREVAFRVSGTETLSALDFDAKSSGHRRHRRARDEID